MLDYSASYSIYGLSYETFTALHDFYLPRTVITSSRWNTLNQCYDITITVRAIIKVNAGNITIDLGAKLFTIENNGYIKLEVL